MSATLKQAKRLLDLFDGDEDSGKQLQYLFAEGFLHDLRDAAVAYECLQNKPFDRAVFRAALDLPPSSDLKRLPSIEERLNFYPQWLKDDQHIILSDSFTEYVLGAARAEVVSYHLSVGVFDLMKHRTPLAEIRSMLPEHHVFTSLGELCCVLKFLASTTTIHGFSRAGTNVMIFDRGNKDLVVITITTSGRGFCASALYPGNSFMTTKYLKGARIFSASSTYKEE